MAVPPKHPKMIIFSRKNPWLLGTTILGNPTLSFRHFRDSPSHYIAATGCCSYKPFEVPQSWAKMGGVEGGVDPTGVVFRLKDVYNIYIFYIYNYMNVLIHNDLSVRMKDKT